MSRFISLSLTAMYAIAVMVISSGGASAQQVSWNPLVSSETASNYDGAIIKVRKRRSHDRDKHRKHSRHSRHSRRGRSSDVAVAILGAIIIGAIIANQGRNYRGQYYGDNVNAHLDWCYNRYRSYRAEDNTFQPYNGPRRQCISPYYGGTGYGGTGNSLLDW